MLSYKKLGMFVFIILILLLAIVVLRDILIPFFLAISIAYLFYPAVKFLEGRQIKRCFAIIIVYGSILVSLTFLTFGIFPILYREINNLIVELPIVFADLEKSLVSFNTFFYNNNYPDGIKAVINESIGKAELKLVNELKGTVGAALSAITYLPLLILTPFLTFYFLNDSRTFALKFIRCFPERHHKKITAFLYDLNHTLMHFIRGQIIVGGLVGLLMTIGLFAIGMPLALFLGMLAAVTELVPFFGPFISGTATVLFALTVTKQKALLAFLVFVIVQQLETNLITPKILGESVGLHPLSIIFLLLLGGKYFGIVGMLIIIPITAVIRILIVHAIPFMRSLESD